MVKVMPKNDTMRRLLKHPAGKIGFREQGPIDWPDDSFTHRRIADGDVTVVEEPKTPSAPVGQAGEASVEQPAESTDH